MKLTRLKLELFLRGIPQKRIAEKAGVDFAYVNRIVNGKQKPSQKVIQAVKELTGIDLSDEEEGR